MTTDRIFNLIETIAATPGKNDKVALLRAHQHDMDLPEVLFLAYNPFYTYGAIALAAPAWASGTALGIIAGNLLPLRAVSALSVALYGMFLAIIIPPARKDKIVAALVAISFALSFACTYLPGISALSDGTRTIILTVAISCAGALLFPVKTQSEEAEQ